MISYPTLILDNFLDHPLAIKNWALSLKYSHPEDHMYPGVRTPELSSINPYFTKFIYTKVLSLYFNTLPIDVEATSYFQIMDNFKGSGWIHQDPGTFTAIIYLSETSSNSNEGTSLFEFKKDQFISVNKPQDVDIWDKLRNKHYETNSLSLEEFRIKQEYEDNLYNKTLSIPSKFNRLICFEGSTHHASNGSLENLIKDRLTLIMWFGRLQTDNIPPVMRSKKAMTI